MKQNLEWKGRKKNTCHWKGLKVFHDVFQKLILWNCLYDLDHRLHDNLYREHLDPLRRQRQRTLTLRFVQTLYRFLNGTGQFLRYFRFGTNITGNVVAIARHRRCCVVGWGGGWGLGWVRDWISTRLICIGSIIGCGTPHDECGDSHEHKCQCSSDQATASRGRICWRHLRCWQSWVTSRTSTGDCLRYGWYQTWIVVHDGRCNLDGSFALLPQRRWWRR